MPGALPSVSLSFHPRPGFLRKSNTKLRAVKHLGMCSLLRIYLGKRILSSFFFNSFAVIPNQRTIRAFAVVYPKF